MSFEKLLIGPFNEIISMDGMPDRGALSDNILPILKGGGMVIKNGIIQQVGKFENLMVDFEGEVIHLQKDAIALPGYIDCHTHIAYKGSRANDFALRNAGQTYLEIAEAGGGIWSTVEATRKASLESLIISIQTRAEKLLKQGLPP